MKILAVDDEKLVLENLLSLLKQVEPEAEILGYTDPEDAFAYLSGNRVDIILLDIELGAYSGVVLAKKCKELCPQVNVIFVTGYSEYAMEALKLHVSGYVMKPVRIGDLREEIDNLRYPLNKCVPQRVRIQTFGNFEVFVDEKTLKFSRIKCRECLAYLIDRKGARVSIPELAAILWEDKPYSFSVRNSTYQVVYGLMKALKLEGVEHIIIKDGSGMAINMDKVDCDFYAVLKGDMEKAKLFTGEYMTNYSWAEVTLGELNRIINSIE